MTGWAQPAAPRLLFADLFPGSAHVRDAGLAAADARAALLFIAGRP